MPRKRSAENKHLPLYVVRRKGNFYLEAKGVLLAKLGGRKCYPLGKTEFEMYSKYREIVGVCDENEVGRVNTTAQLIDKYMLEVTLKKSASGHKPEMRRCALLKKVFGHMDPNSITKKDVQRYLHVRTSGGTPTSANREVALLSAILKQAELWGVIDRSSPCTRISYNKEKPRKRYVSDEEYMAFRDFVEKKNLILACYLDFKYVTGLRAGDIRALKKSCMTEEGLFLKIGKNGEERLMVWSRDLRKATSRLIDACGREKVNKKGVVERPRMQSEYIFHNRTGGAYSCDGWCSIFYRYMRKAIDEGVLTEWFREHDIRAKAGSDHKSLEEASKFLAHLSPRVTAEHYRRKVERIKPLL